MRAVCACLILAGCGAASPPAAPVAIAGDVAITHVTVVAMTSDGEAADQTVVIRGDRIVAAAPSGRLALPAGVTVIDGAPDGVVLRGTWLPRAALEAKLAAIRAQRAAAASFSSTRMSATL
ncbi:MAG TPA: hypothetical protein VFP84_28490 [Kofleriaceae bacterium]|nr:hypothetical protein [Kofleriaceae bacterium]